MFRLEKIVFLSDCSFRFEALVVTIVAVIGAVRVDVVELLFLSPILTMLEPARLRRFLGELK